MWLKSVFGEGTLEHWSRMKSLGFLRNRFLVFWYIIKTVPLVSDRRGESASDQQVLNEDTIKEAKFFPHLMCL